MLVVGQLKVMICIYDYDSHYLNVSMCVSCVLLVCFIPFLACLCVLCIMCYTYINCSLNGMGI